MPITIKKNVMAYKNPSDGTYTGVDAVNDATLEERIGAVETELPDKYEKPANGIPASDIASGVIPDVSGKTDQGAVATPYASLTWPVTAGKYCFQNGYVYRAKQDIATSESWTAAHWDQVVLGDEVSDVKTAIDGMKPIAQQSDIGKALILKTIDQTGKPTAFEYGEAGSIDPQDIADAVDEWLDEHPEATTTVEDGSITEAKLDSDLQGVVNGITVEVKSKNLINPNNLVTGRLQSDGTVNSMSSYKTSDYILLEAGKTYKFTRESLTTAGAVLLMDYSGYGLYNTSKEWIANSRVFDSWPNNTILSITPENDCYIRVTGKSDLFTSDASGLYILQQTTALDGYESWFAPYTVVSAVVKSDIVQSSGSNLNKVMSQKAVTEHVSGSVSDGLDQISEYVIGKNKYNPSDCTPQDQKMYNTTTGVQTDATAYAITGKIPVEANTAYVFSSTSKAIQYLRVFYYSGESGGTSISNEEINSGVGFTTPADCTFVAFNLFGGSHTTEEYNAAIAAAQLEKGAVPTQYEEYERKRKVLPKDIEGGDQLTAIEDITEVKSLINLYDKTLAVDGKYYNTGVPYSDAGWAISGKIPVKPNTQYCVSRDPTTALQFPGTIYSYGSDGAYLGTLNIGHYVYNYLTVFTTSANVYYISFNMKLASHTTQDFNDTIDTIMLCYGTQRPLTYSAYNAEKVLIEDKLSNAYFNNANCFKGKKWLALGTSITWYDSQKYQSGVHTDEVCHGYVGNIARRKPLIAINEGISGATLADVSENSLINRYTSIDWDVDIATIEFGVNDYGYDIDVGTAADAAGNTTFASCLKTVIEYALAQNPKLCLVICTEPDVRGTNQNNNGNTLKDYTDVTLEIATQYRLPVCDWYYKSGINAINEGSASVDYMTADGTHPNDAGHMRMGAMLNQVFDSLLC